MSKSEEVDPRWGKNFVAPIARVMKEKGIAYLLITIRDDGKAAYVLEPAEPDEPDEVVKLQNALPGVGEWAEGRLRVEEAPVQAGELGELFNKVKK